MINTTQSLTDFKQNPTPFVEELKKSKTPLVLTVDGKAEVVVLDADAYQEILDKIEYTDNVNAIKEGVASFERGEGKPARKALHELGEKYGLWR